jgi:Mrp family chromosome partitioning ATPase
LVVDACLQSPAQHRLLGVPGESGLHDWSGEGAPPYRQVPKSEQLWLLPAGAGSTGTDHWLRRTAQLDKLGPRVRGDFDFVLWDTAALGREPDGLLLAPHVDGVLVVVESDRTLKERLRDLRERLDAVHLPVLGAIMNRCGRYWPWSNRLFQ